MLIITSIAFFILAIVSLPVVLMVSVVSFDAPGSTGQPGRYLWVLLACMIPVAFVAGQALAWIGYIQKKTIVIVLVMCLSFSPLFLLGLLR